MSTLWLAAIFASACPGVLTAQTEEPPMTGMTTGDAPSQAAMQAASMTGMMGAPGLVPFDIMTGQAGKWMVGYQYMLASLDGNLVGTKHISEAKILERFPAAPTDMTMQMHIRMLMYAPTDKLTVMAMLPYVKMSRGEGMGIWAVVAQLELTAHVNQIGTELPANVEC